MAAFSPLSFSAGAMAPALAPTLPVAEPVAPLPAPDWPAIPGYTIEAEIGRGGMGVIYRATDVRLKRQVALKMVLDTAVAGEGSDGRQRFRAEAEAVARLQHPNIVQIHEV